jgi:hypothetical protein
MAHYLDNVTLHKHSTSTLPAHVLGGGGARELAHGTTPRRGLGAIKGESDIVKLLS